MTEIPEHLLKRAQAARDAAAAAAPAEPEAPAAAAETPAAAASEPAADPRIPAHLLERSRAAKASRGGAEGADAPASSGGGAVAVADRVTSVVQAVPTGGGVPVGAGPASARFRAAPGPPASRHSRRRSLQRPRSRVDRRPLRR